jgi:ribosomal protein L28
MTRKENHKKRSGPPGGGERRVCVEKSVARLVQRMIGQVTDRHPPFALHGVALDTLPQIPASPPARTFPLPSGRSPATLAAAFWSGTQQLAMTSGGVHMNWFGRRCGARAMVVARVGGAAWQPGAEAVGLTRHVVLGLGATAAGPFLQLQPRAERRVAARRNYCETPGRFASEGGSHSSAQRRQGRRFQPFVGRRGAAMSNYCETPGRFASEGGSHSSAQRRQGRRFQPFVGRRGAAMSNY